MNKIVKPKIQQMPRSIDRISFVYLDRAVLSVDGGAIIAYREGMKLAIPAASIIALILGPGTKITHEAIKLCSGVGTTIVWMSSDQTRFYASGRSLAESSKLLEAQARIVSNTKLRMNCAKKMYGLRFPGIDVSSKKSMNALRGMEGARMREIYKTEAKNNGIEWNGRYAEFDNIEIEESSIPNIIVNKSLTIGNQVLYAITTGMLSTLGMTPGLGVIHCNRHDSLLFDIADLYKAETSIPIAFQVAKEMGDKTDSNLIEKKTRTLLREKFNELKILKRMVKDIKYLFLNEEEPLSQENGFEDLLWVDESGGLWTKDGVVPGSVNYALYDDLYEKEVVA